MRILSVGHSLVVDRNEVSLVSKIAKTGISRTTPGLSLVGRGYISHTSSAWRSTFVTYCGEHKVALQQDNTKYDVVVLIVVQAGAKQWVPFNPSLSNNTETSFLCSPAAPFRCQDQGDVSTSC